MKQKQCAKHEIKIQGKGPEDFEWSECVQEIIIPCPVFFRLIHLPLTVPVKKMAWDFGDNTKITIITNRKQDIDKIEVAHTFRPKQVGKTTLGIGATAYSANHTYVMPVLVIKNIITKVSNNYIDPEVLKNQIVQYYKDNNMTDELANSIQQIANRLAYAPNFVNYSYREEMSGDALIKMLEALTTKKFKPKKGNPFSYFTKIAFHAFCNRIKKEKRARKALDELQAETFDNMVGSGELPAQHRTYHDSYDNDYGDDRGLINEAN